MKINHTFINSIKFSKIWLLKIYKNQNLNSSFTVSSIKQLKTKSLISNYITVSSS